MSDFQDRPRKSRGNLYRNHCPTDNAPPYTGLVLLTDDHIRHILSQLEETGLDHVPIQVAIWPYQSAGSRYLSAEISPGFGARRKAKKSKKASKAISVEEFWVDDANEVDPREFDNE